MSSNAKGLASPRGKVIMNFAYGIGASIVILGALFKILHWPGAVPMLTAGMVTEAILFALGAFDPPHQEATKWDWSKVYPNLTAENPEAQGAGDQSIQASMASTAQLNAFKEEDVEKWNESLSKLSKTADNLSKLSDVGDVSETYIGKLNKAGDAAEQFGKVQKTSADLIANSTEDLSKASSSAAKALDSSAANIEAGHSSFADNYKKITETLQQKLQAMEQLAGNHQSTLESVGKNLSAINSVYELQLTAVNKDLKAKETQVSTQEKVNEQLAQIQKIAEELATVSNTGKEESRKLNNSIAELNNVYGNMLSSLNA